MREEQKQLAKRALDFTGYSLVGLAATCGFLARRSGSGVMAVRAAAYAGAGACFLSASKDAKPAAVEVEKTPVASDCHQMAEEWVRTQSMHPFL